MEGSRKVLKPIHVGDNTKCLGSCRLVNVRYPMEGGHWNVSGMRLVLRFIWDPSLWLLGISKRFKVWGKSNF